MMAMTFFAPMRLACKADRILASSSLVTEQKISVVSTASSLSRFASAQSPTSTMVLDSSSAMSSALTGSRSMIFTWWSRSSRRARFFSMLPPPARITRRIGLSMGLSSFITAGICRLAARKNTRSFSSMMVLPSGIISCPLR